MGLAAVAGGAAVASAGYQRLGEAEDRRRFPPPGRLVNVGGRRLHLWPVGGSGPTVVALPALGGSGLDWMGIRRAAGAELPVLLYDRAGLGWSDPGPWPRTAGRMADELHALLQAARVPGPFVLAGNSLGGLIARVYAARFRDTVAGLVLVDSSHEDQQERLLPYDGVRRDWRRLRRGIHYLLTWRGWRRAAVELGRTPLRRELQKEVPPDLLDAALAQALRSAHRRAAAQEMLGFRAGAREVRAEAGHLGSLPLTVITGGPEGREAWYPGWLQMQQDLARLSDNSVHLMATHAGHFVHQDDPELVVRALRETAIRAAAYTR